jgi:hypothetical protein
MLDIGFESLLFRTANVSTMTVANSFCSVLSGDKRVQLFPIIWPHVLTIAFSFSRMISSETNSAASRLDESALFVHY